MAEEIRPFVAFNATLRSAYQSFIDRLEMQARSLVRNHLAAATSEFAGFTHDMFLNEQRTLERKSSTLLDDDRNWNEVS